MIQVTWFTYFSKYRHLIHLKHEVKSKGRLKCCQWILIQNTLNYYWAATPDAIKCLSQPGLKLWYFPQQIEIFWKEVTLEYFEEEQFPTSRFPKFFFACNVYKKFVYRKL